MLIAMPLSAASIRVTTTDPAVAQDGMCSLAEAIDNANDDDATHGDCAVGSGADVVVLDLAADYVLDQVHTVFRGPNGLPPVRSEIVIEGYGSTIERSTAAPDFRLLAVEPTGALELRHLTLRNGGPGGLNSGGAIYNRQGVVRLVSTVVTDSTAFEGGGLFNDAGSMTLNNSFVSLNTAQAGEGGGIRSYAGFEEAALVVERTVVADNRAVQGGGVATEGSEVRILDSTISGNVAYSELGFAWCGGMILVGGAVDIVGSTITGNITESLVERSGFGGGVCIADNTTTISNSTISGNEARGAATTTGRMTGRGGGIMVIGGAALGSPTSDTFVTLENSTICDNSAAYLGGGVSVYRNSGDFAVELQIRNTIVADNLEEDGSLLGNCIAESPAVITSADFNVADDSTCELTSPNDQVVADVRLSPLGDHGGPTWTHAIEEASPAIDIGGECSSADQRGYLRPADGDGDGMAACDSGAVEYGAYPWPHSHGTHQPPTMPPADE